MDWKFWKPRHTVATVAQRLAFGLENGSIVLDEPLAEEPFEDDFADDGMVVQIDVPEGTSDAVILDRVKLCAITVDQENRKQGGTGLRVGKILIQFPKVKVAFRPRNSTEPTNEA